MVPDQTGVLDIEAAGCVVGRNVEHRDAPTPLLPLDRQIMQEAEVITPPRRETHGPQLPPRGSRDSPDSAGFGIYPSCKSVVENAGGSTCGRRLSRRPKCHTLEGRPVVSSTGRFLTL